MGGTAVVISREELKERLKLGRPLRVKLGVDPTAPDIHLGHTVAIEKLRQFQELGHQAILLIGDFTATIGDPSGRSVTRPPLSREQVLENAETYTKQAFKILDRDRTEIVYNGDWFRKMTYEEVLKLNSRVTMQQMLAGRISRPAWRAARRCACTKCSTRSCRAGIPWKSGRTWNWAARTSFSTSW